MCYDDDDDGGGGGDYYSSVVQFEIREGDTFRCSFIVYDCFGYPGLFVFSYEVEFFSRSVKNFVGILMGIALNM